MINTNQRVLLVDDFEIIRTLERNILTEIGFASIDEAVDGEEARVKIHKAFKDNAPYSLVFCDWNMPRLSGLDLLLLIRKSEDLKSLTFVMVTAEGEPSAVIKAIDRGADDYILKPFTKDSFTNKLIGLEKRLKK